MANQGEESQLDAKSGEGALAIWALRTFTRWKANRAVMEQRWRTAYAAWKQDLTLDPKGPWKKSEYDADWMSDVMDDTARRKILGAFCMIRDSVTKGNKLAFMFKKDIAGETLPMSPAVLPPVSPTPEPPAGMERVQEPQSTVEDGELRQWENKVHDQVERTDGLPQYVAAIFDSCVYGRGWIKRMIIDVPILTIGGGGVFEDEKSMPAMKRVSPWRVYWDMENPDMQANDGVMHVEKLSAYALRKLKDDKTYDAAAIDRVIEKMKGSNDSASATTAYEPTSDPPGERQLTQRRKLATTIEFWGRSPRAMVEKQIAEYGKRSEDNFAADAEISNLDTGDDVECTMTVANGICIRCMIRQPRRRPLYTMEFEPSGDSMDSTGVADATMPVQRTQTGLRRALENNAKLSSNLMFAWKPSKIRGKLDKIYPGVRIEVSEDAKNVADAFEQIVIQDITGPLATAMEFFEGVGDRSSLVPRSEQGQPDGNDPNTAYEMSERLKRAGLYLAMVIMNSDQMLESVLRDMLMDNIWLNEITPTVPLAVKALGFTSFENRTIRAANIMKVFELRQMDDEVKLITKVRHLVTEYIQSLEMAPDQVLKTYEEIQQELQRQTEMQAQAEAQIAAAGKMNGADALALAKLQAEIDDLTEAANLKRVKAKVDTAKAVSDIQRAHDDQLLDAARNPPGQQQQPAPSAAKA